MFARKKIDPIESPEDQELRDRVIQAAVGQKQQEAMLKDIHLIEAALKGGMRVAALDETVRGYFRSASASVPSCGLSVGSIQTYPKKSRWVGLRPEHLLMTFGHLATTQRGNDRCLVGYRA